MNTNYDKWISFFQIEYQFSFTAWTFYFRSNLENTSPETCKRFETNESEMLEESFWENVSNVKWKVAEFTEAFFILCVP